MNYIPLARIGARIGHCRLVLGILSSRRAWLAHVGGSLWACKGFWIPTCWYRQCESLVLEVLPNANPQHEGSHNAVEYRLKRVSVSCVPVD